MPRFPEQPLQARIWSLAPGSGEVTDSTMSCSPSVGAPHGKETLPKPEHSMGQHSMPTNENQGCPAEMLAWRTSIGVRGEDVVVAGGSAASFAGLEIDDDDMAKGERMWCEKLSRRR